MMRKKIKIDLSENTIDRNEHEAIINFTSYFTSHIGNYWQKLDIPRKRKLQQMIFLKKVTYIGDKFKTGKISPSFKLIKAFRDEDTPMVTPRGIPSLRLHSVQAHSG